MGRASIFTTGEAARVLDVHRRQLLRLFETRPDLFPSARRVEGAGGQPGGWVVLSSDVRRLKRARWRPGPRGRPRRRPGLDVQESPR